MKIDKKNKARFDELGYEKKKNSWANCLLGGKSVMEAIGKSFERNDGIQAKDVQSITLTQISSSAIKARNSHRR